MKSSKKLISACIGLWFALYQGYSGAQGSCAAGQAPALPSGTPLNFYVGASFGSIYYSPLSGVPATTAAAVATWNATNVNGRLGATVLGTVPDCPPTSAANPFLYGVFRIGAFPFYQSTCYALTRQPGSASITGPGGNPALGQQVTTALAFVDYLPPATGQPTAGYSRSILLNANLLWSNTGEPGKNDLQAVLTHEYGHVLGIGHQDGGDCINVSPSVNNTCTVFPNKSTMSNYIHLGDSCQRSLNTFDVLQINSLY